jgi:4-hydroxyproline epimerase
MDASCVAGVIFFNNVGYLGMCGHGAVGVVATLAHLGRIDPGEHRFETPVGVVSTLLHANGRVTLRNVPSYRHTASVGIDVPRFGRIVGDIAWGGNWFFLAEDHGQQISLQNLETLTDLAWQIRQQLIHAGITGTDGQEIDHIELFGPPSCPDADSKNFVLCPGRVYDRSPCGTGTSAKLACLYEDGKLAEGQRWRQEGIVGSVFEGYVRVENARILPHIVAAAHVNAEASLILDPRDPFCLGIRE